MTLHKRIFIFATLTVMLFTSLASVIPVAAESLCSIPDPDDKTVCYDDFYSGNNILYYDPNAKACIATAGTSTQASAPLTGNSNAEKIFLYLTEKGLTAEQAAGVLGNFQQESGFDPAIIQGGAIAGANYTPVNSVGFGIAQWTFTARQGPLVNLASSTGRSVTDLSLQLDFLWQELNGTHARALASLKTANTPENAAYVFHRDFEGSADSEATVVLVRGGNARTLYEQYKNLSPTADAGDAQNFVNDPTNPYNNPATTAASSCSSTTATGNANGKLTNFISDSFTIYTQCQEQTYGGSWGSKRTPRGVSMCDEASIPTSLAMIATNITGMTVTPDKTIDYYTQQKLWYDGGGSLISSPITAATKFNMRAESMTEKADVAAYKKVFADGGLIMAISTGTAPFTSNRHAIVIRGITADGKFMIANPARSDLNTAPANQPEINKILTDIRSDTGSAVYAFYKQ